MRIFALETDNEKLARSFLSKDEEILLTVKFHPFLFIMRFLVALLTTALTISIGIGAWYVGIPLLWIMIVLGVLWFIFIFLPLITGFIDWQFDSLIVTTEEVIVIDQSSLFRVHIRQMNLDNIASVSSETQYWNLFPFGILSFDLKEGIGQKISLRYIPQAPKVAAIVSDAIVVFQRRRAAIAHGHGHPGISDKRSAISNNTDR